MLNLSIPENLKPLRDKVLNFVEERVYPQEKTLHESDRESRMAGLRELMQQA